MQVHVHGCFCLAVVLALSLCVPAEQRKVAGSSCRHFDCTDSQMTIKDGHHGRDVDELL
jgi:hypothetical protein